jgi:hypothetical protein
MEVAYKPGYLNGYRGYRTARTGYRHYSDGYWDPLAAFALSCGYVVVPSYAPPEPFCDDNFAPSSDSRPRRCPRY